MSRLHLSRPSVALVVSVVALIVALGGTSYAAFALPANSVGSKQLKNGAVTSAKIKHGAVGVSQLNVSDVTVPNALHATDAAHATSADTATNAGHAHTADSAPLPVTLPTGVTLTGTFALRGSYDMTTCLGCADTAAVGISFQIPLAAAPTVHVILLGAPVPAGCSGTRANPGASPGNLCIFEGSNYNAGGLAACDPTLSGCTFGASRFGTAVVSQPTGTGIWDDFGTWAVTG
jgi:hypothetical protein